MKIVHISNSDVAGGAARSAFRLHRGLRQLGCRSSMFVRRAYSKDTDVIEMRQSKQLLDRLEQRLRERRILSDFRRYRRTRPPGYEPFHDCRSPFWRDFLRELPMSDVLNLHGVDGSFLDYEKFFARVAPRTRIVWTLHDMNAFTGGCHYDLGCGRYVHVCGNCPQLASEERRDFAYRTWKRKAKAFSPVDSRKLHFVSPSRWLAKELVRSSLAGRFPVSVIPYGIDLEDFAPRDREVCKNILGLPAGVSALLFVADGVDNRRKGFELLVSALTGIEKEVPIALITVGRNKPQIEIDVPWTHVETIHSDRLLPVVYSAADLFVISSLQDNLPNTVLEAMACGTPIVGFSVGGIPDMVRSGVNGMLVPEKNVEKLRNEIVRLLRNRSELHKMGSNGRRIAVQEYSLELQAQRYVELYEALLEPC